MVGKSDVTSDTIKVDTLHPICSM